jgi:hypothetical protein
VGTGSAAIFSNTFIWGIAVDGRLQVQMDDFFTTSEYLKLANKASGDLVLADYAVSGDPPGVPGVMSTLSWKDQGLVWDASDLVDNIAGDYKSEGRVRLDNGIAIPVTSVYRLHPDGTGLMQTPVYDLATGLLAGYDTYGICVAVTGNTLEISRTQSSVPDSPQPSVIDCSGLLDPFTDGTETGTFTSYTLLDIGAGGSYRMLAQNSTNECGLEPFLFPQPLGCVASNPLVGDDIYPAIFTKVPFIGGATPIIAVNDVVPGFPQSSLDVDLLANDIVDAVAVAAATGGFIGPNTILGTPNDPVTLVEVLISGVWQTTGPFFTGFGNASVILSPDGVVNYISDETGAQGTDIIYYRLTDTNGNTSVAAMVMDYTPA